MDRKKHRIIYYALCFFIILSCSQIFTSCFLIIRNSKEYKRPLVKSININSYSVVKIVLDNTNGYKKIGEINAMKLIKYASIIDYEENDKEIVIERDISEYKERLQEDGKYRIEIKWFGGHLFIDTEYKNGQFIVLDEHFGDRY